ncbi:MAG: hypothetical protein STSR0003_28490 [Smithella sp.]
MKRKTLKTAAAGLFVLSMFLIYGGAAKALAQSPEIFVQLGHRSTDVTAAAFSADGKYLVTGSGDKTVKLWHPDFDSKCGFSQKNINNINESVREFSKV